MPSSYTLHLTFFYIVLISVCHLLLVDYLLNCQHVLCSKIDSFHFEKLTASWTLTFLYCYFSIIYGMWILSNTGLAVWLPFFLSSRYFEAQYKIIIIKKRGKIKCELYPSCIYAWLFSFLSSFCRYKMQIIQNNKYTTHKKT